ncbi:hypothetical protein [Streptomyces uncialis]|uniref:hypothetical protein n=1 Tax=Streptomyces uncialis TaxID=1048205 RepID=UPI0038644117|nr:hypothetical protein OG268_16785 [Streptomyces uncialis]
MVASRLGGRALDKRGARPAIRTDFAEADQWVFYGMAAALALAFLCALAHPGTRVRGTRITGPGGQTGRGLVCGVVTGGGSMGGDREAGPGAVGPSVPRPGTVISPLPLRRDAHPPCS